MATQGVARVAIEALGYLISSRWDFATEMAIKPRVFNVLSIGRSEERLESS